ncbi:PREDICTED: translation initiation factor IF-2-like [Rhinopithecus bieti]|uniref:translation initiation factor IF-2-like n=1 Tax=Rhinopithecus bieti TaxID=61621 RepID=UPI00083C2F92|nr:PREDICTED: translation initiation factor IF-2-like [Rhinopithecus bieti]
MAPTLGAATAQAGTAREQAQRRAAEAERAGLSARGGPEAPPRSRVGNKGARAPVGEDPRPPARSAPAPHDPQTGRRRGRRRDGGGSARRSRSTHPALSPAEFSHAAPDTARRPRAALSRTAAPPTGRRPRSRRVSQAYSHGRPPARGPTQTQPPRPEHRPCSDQDGTRGAPPKLRTPTVAVESDMLSQAVGRLPDTAGQLTAFQRRHPPKCCSPH